MNRQEKEACVARLTHDFAASSGAFVVGVKGLSVAQVHALRTALRGQHGKLQVVKNTLSWRALSQTDGMQGLEPYCKEQVALVFAQHDAPAVARTLCAYAQEHERLRVIAGCVERRVITADAVKWLSTLPSRDILLAQVCGLLRAPMTSQVTLLKHMLVRLVFVVQQIRAQRAEGQ